MGDVALTVPVIKQVLAEYKDTTIVFLTKKTFIPIFGNTERLEFVTPDLKNYKGFVGLLKLFREIKKQQNISKVIDLHDVLRTKLLRFFFMFSFVKTYKINKGRKQKRKATRKHNKELKLLKHSSIRYFDVFKQAGLKVTPDLNYINNKELYSQNINENIKFKTKNIGLAPFAFHKQKTYPVEMMEVVVKELNNRDFGIYIFGGGNLEKEIAEGFEQKFENVVSLVGKYDLNTELQIIKSLNIMLTMDSANMHLATLTGTKTISIWGATHPYLGFYPYGNLHEKIFIQISEKELTCRPCSVFGKKECYRGDLACMNNIEPEQIIKTIIQNI